VVEVLLILVALGLVAACGAFVAAEFSFVTVDRASVDRAAEAGDRKAQGVQEALRSLSTQLSAAQVGITVTNLLIGFIAEPAVADLIAEPLASLGIAGGASTGVSLVIALVLATGCTMVFGELVPKNLAISRPLETARAVQGFQRGFTRATAIPVRFMNATANRVLRRLGVEPQEELASARSPEELSSLVRRSAEQGTLEPGTATLVERSLAFGERRAADVMTPRGTMHVVRSGAPVNDVLREARATGRSRFPVLTADGEEVVGAVHVKHAMAVPHPRREEVPVDDVMLPPVLVPSSVELDPLLEQLRGGGLQMAIVVDEWGNVDGIVTLEDLVEEIVGDVRDEHDTRDDSARRERDGGWSLSGLLRPDEVAARVGIILPEDSDYETLGGLVGAHLERIPSTGDRVELEAITVDRDRHVVTLTVQAMDALRVDRVRLEHEPLEDADDPGTETAADSDGDGRASSVRDDVA
jgi:CBS domain containing-hemolysin-like protein